jgi:hypothetical protein
VGPLAQVRDAVASGVLRRRLVRASRSRRCGSVGEPLAPTARKLMQTQRARKSVSLELRSGPGAVKRPQQRLPPKASKFGAVSFQESTPPLADRGGVLV